MKRSTKILTSASAVVAIAAMIVTLSLIKPLLRSSTAQVIYSVDEDFKDNGMVFSPLFGRDVYYLYLPEVNAKYRWWTIDVEHHAVHVPRTPRSLLSIPYVSRDEPFGASIKDLARTEAWSWIFTERGVSFSGPDVTCVVQTVSMRSAGTGSTTAY